MAETQFKKGNRPYNTAKIGERRKCTFSDGSYYWKEKTGEPDQWRFCHHLIWEASNGPIVLRPLLADRRVVRAAIDSTGIGLGLVQDMEDDFPGKVQGVNFATTEPVTRRIQAEGRKAPTARVTEIMATELAEAHEDKRLSYPCDAIMRDDLRKPHKVTSATGRVSIAAESTQTGHADHFWSLALALRAASSSGVPFAWTPPIDLTSHYYRGRH